MDCSFDNFFCTLTIKFILFACFSFARCFVSHFFISSFLPFGQSHPWRVKKLHLWNYYQGWLCSVISGISVNFDLLLPGIFFTPITFLTSKYVKERFIYLPFIVYHLSLPPFVCLQSFHPHLPFLDAHILIVRTEGSYVAESRQHCSRTTQSSCRKNFQLKNKKNKFNAKAIVKLFRFCRIVPKDYFLAESCFYQLNAGKRTQNFPTQPVQSYF